MRPYFLVTLSAAALSVGAGLIARQRGASASTPCAAALTSSEGFDETARTVTRRALQYFVVPIWLGAGVSDWWCHKASGIDETTGLKESAIHLLMMLEAGAPILAALLIEVDPFILSLMIAVFFLHEATAMWDVSYAVTARNVSPLEQHVHSFLEMVPLLGLTLISLLHWRQLEALFGLRLEPPRGLTLKKKPLGAAYVGVSLGGMLLLELLPYFEEAVRDWRAHPGRLQPPAAA